jgi:hypothetical protein
MGTGKNLKSLSGTAAIVAVHGLASIFSGDAGSNPLYNMPEAAGDHASSPTFGSSIMPEGFVTETGFLPPGSSSDK